MTTQRIKERLLAELEALPEEKLREVLDFVEFLQAREAKKPRQEARPPSDLDPEGDPILKLIGIADVDPFSQSIDEELYGV